MFNMKTKTKFNLLAFLLLIIVCWWMISKLFFIAATLCIIFIAGYLIYHLTSDAFKRNVRRIKRKLRRKT